MSVFVSAKYYDDDIASKDEFVVNNAGYTKVCDFESLTRRPNGRRDYQLLYMKSGCGFFENDEGVYNLQKGQMFLYKPYEKQIYRYPADKGTKVFWVHFSGTLTEKILSAAQINQCVFDVEDFTEFEETVHFIIKNLKSNNELSRILCASKLITLICVAGIKKSALNDKKPDREINNILNYISTHYYEDTRNEEYAKKCGLSLSHFMRRFKECTGTTPAAYRNLTRIKTAEGLLVNSEYNISQTAFTVGFTDSLYFSRVFKKINGISPQKFRKRSEKNNLVSN